MTFFLDANVLVYGWVRSPAHDACAALLTAIAEGAADGRATTAVLEEVYHLELSGRVDGLAGITRHAYDLLSPLVAITDEAFRLALGVKVKALGANDRLHVAACLASGVETFVSADRAFDGIRGIRRVDALDPRAMRRLLASATGGR